MTYYDEIKKIEVSSTNGDNPMIASKVGEEFLFYYISDGEFKFWGFLYYIFR